MRGLLLALVALVAVPLLGVILAGSLSERASLIDAAGERMAGLASVAAERELDVYQQAGETIETLRRMAAVAGLSAGCHDLLARVLADHADYNTLGVVEADGTVTCHSLKSETHPFANLDFLRHALTLDQAGFAISQPVFGTVTHQHIVVLAKRGLDGDRIVFASLRLSALAAALARSHPPANARIALIDPRSGVVIAALPADDQPDGVEVGPAFLARLHEALAQSGSLVAPALGAAAPMVLGVASMTAVGDDAPIVVAGVPYADALASANAHLARNLAVAFGAMLAAACIAWVIAERLMLRPLQSIGEAAARLGQGAFDTRIVAFERFPEELAALARTVNASAGHLQASDTAMRTSQARAEASELEYRTLADNAVDMIFRLDVGFVRRYVSPASHRLLGYAPEELVGRTPGSMIHPDDAERVEAAFGSVARGSERASVCNRIRHRDGHYVDVEVHLRCLRDPAGTLTGIVGVMRDISDRVAAERERLISEQRFRLLAENTSDMITLVDSAFCRKWVSPAATTLLGYAPDELVGTTPRETAHPDDRAGVEAALAHTATVQPGCVGAVHQYRMLRKDGSAVWVESAARRLAEGDGYVFNVRDISVRHEAEERLAAANRTLEMIALRDGLTGLSNRRHFDETLEAEFRRAARNQTSLSLVLVDIDMFKQFNDTYGHPAGDASLRAVAEAACSVLRRSGDLAARYGGEELAILLPDTQMAGAALVAERLCMAVRALDREHAASPFGRLTVSAGIAAALPGRDAASAVSLIERADEALYRAKREGRDRVCTAAPDDADLDYASTIVAAGNAD